MPPVAAVLLNPHAGGGRARALVTPLQAALPTGCALHVAGSVEQAREALLRLPQGSRAVIAGGDGTLNRLLAPLVERRLEVGLLPCGSGNDAARALGVQAMGWRDALELALHGPTTAIDLGQVQLRLDAAAAPATVLFASSLTAGFDSAVGRRALTGPKALRGLPRYLLATLREIANLRNWRLDVTADGRTLSEGPLLLASCLNTPTYASGMPCAPGARIDDGRLDALLAGPFARIGTLGMLPLLLAGQHGRHPRVHLRPFAELHWQAVDAVPVAADGEYLGEFRRAHVMARPAALRMVRAP